MVSRFRDHDDDNADDCSDTQCPGCLFRAELARHLEVLSKADESEWMEEVGTLTALMHEAIDAIHSLRMGEVSGKHFYEDPAAFAADAVSAVASHIVDIRDSLMSD